MRGATSLSRPTPPTESEIRAYLQSLSNWGRWGPSDLMGTLNHIDGERRARAFGLVRDGHAISCASPVHFAAEGAGRDESGHLVPGVAPRPIRYVLQGADGADPRSEQRRPTFDGFLIEPHGPVLTHLDAPNHTVYQGTLYNGMPATGGPMGLTDMGGIDIACDGICGRGVLLDLPRAQGRSWLDDGEAAYPDDLESAERFARVRVSSGDILIVRTGYRARLAGGAEPGSNDPRPGLQAACLPWFQAREISMLTSDVPNDVRPHGYDSLGLPIHTIGMWAMGLWLMDNCNLERLADHCAATGRYEFLVVVAPLVLTSGTGSPVNPLCIF